ncbi:hypothetical protein DXG03_003069 [Asterophora parasitica]|uniref:Uncharacterized protein n=1 Tax=Asterophora parasitica TaxID=117018 RepID=A0A9P7G3E3_9AGAR|nr:hypothetical protein DXG03_003069 [Asterophora parasitica]
MIKAAIKADGSRIGTSKQIIANYIPSLWNQTSINAHFRLTHWPAEDGITPAEAAPGEKKLKSPKKKTLKTKSQAAT